MPTEMILYVRKQGSNVWHWRQECRWSRKLSDEWCEMCGDLRYDQDFTKKPLGKRPKGDLCNHCKSAERKERQTGR